MKLYHYVHCPFCVRVRMGLGLLNIKYESQVLPYDDEATPLGLTGKKMLPIVVENGVAMNESLDILKKADTKGLLNWQKYEDHRILVDSLIDRIGSPVHSLVMPYWIWTPEFDEKSRAYFQKKKEVKRGPFKDLVKNRQSFIDKLDPLLIGEVLPHLSPYFKGDKLSIVDIMLAAHLWGLYVVPEYQFPPEIHSYLQRLKAQTGFNYHQDYWS